MPTRSKLFFPTGHGRPALVQTVEAKSVCARCTVTVDCLAFALRTGQDQGVWGGLDDAERRDLHQRMRRRHLTVLAAPSTSR